MQRDLSQYSTGDWSPGRSRLWCGVWYFVSLLVFESGWMPVSGLKCRLLRLFGARIGRGVVLRPNVRIKFPWRLKVGDHCWIGRGVWIDNLADVTLGDHVCVSQDAYFCTGSHDHRSPGFELRNSPVLVADGAWIAARAVVLGGVSVGRNSVVSACSLASRDVPDFHVATGVPAVSKPVK